MQAANYQKYAQRQHVLVFEWVHLLRGMKPPLHWHEFKQRYVDAPDPSAPMFDEFRETYGALKAGMDSRDLKYLPGPGWYGLRRIEPHELRRWASVARRVAIPAELATVLPVSPTEAPAERKQRLAKRRDELKSAKTRRWLQVLAEEEGRSVSLIKQLLKDAPTGVARTTSKTVSKRR